MYWYDQQAQKNSSEERSVIRISMKLLTNFDKIVWGVGCVTGNRWLDLGSVPDRDADSEIFERNFYHYGIGGNSMNFADKQHDISNGIPARFAPKRRHSHAQPKKLIRCMLRVHSTSIRRRSTAVRLRSLKSQWCKTSVPADTLATVFYLYRPQSTGVMNRACSGAWAERKTERLALSSLARSLLIIY